MCAWVPKMNELIVWGKNCHLEDLRELNTSVYMKSLAQFRTVPNVQLQIEMLYGGKGKKNTKQPQKVFLQVYHKQ